MGGGRNDTSFPAARRSPPADTETTDVSDIAVAAATNRSESESVGPVAEASIILELFVASRSFSFFQYLFFEYLFVLFAIKKEISMHEEYSRGVGRELSC